MFLFDCLFFALKAVAYMLLYVPITWYCTCLSHVITLAYHMVLKLPRACFSSVEDVSLLTVLYFSFRSIPTILRENRRLWVFDTHPQVRIGIFQTKMTARKGSCSIPTILRRNNRGLLTTTNTFSLPCDYFSVVYSFVVFIDVSSKGRCLVIPIIYYETWLKLRH